MKRIFTKILGLAMALLLLTSVLGFASPVNNTIQANVSVNGIDVSGMTREQALSKLKSTYDSQLNNSYVLLNYGTILWRLDYKDMSVVYNYPKAIDEALSVTREPASTTDSSISTNGPNTTGSSIDVKYPKKNIVLTMTYSKKNITNFLNGIGSRINVKPVNATLKISGKTFTIIDGKKGLSLDIDTVTSKIIKSITPNGKSKIVLSTKVTNPEYNKDNLLDVKDKLGEYTTHYKKSDIDRVTNIKIAAGNITNIIVMPNEILSVNKTIGPRLEENGFKLAHVIVQNKFVDGIGGGICQVSTTLYNAALYANLKIIERNHHSIPSTYVSLGRDATISGDSKDLKIQNNTPYPLYIVNEVEGNHITFKIYGKNVYPNRKVKIKTQILAVKKPTTTTVVEDPTLPKGTVVVDTKPSSGYTVKSFREVYENGKLLYVEDLYTDKYPTINEIKKVGTKTKL